MSETLPTIDVRFPFLIFSQMPTKNIGSIRGWFLGYMHQMHMNFFNFASAFAVITAWAGCHNIIPDVRSAHVTRDHMING